MFGNFFKQVNKRSYSTARNEAQREWIAVTIKRAASELSKGVMVDSLKL